MWYKVENGNLIPAPLNYYSESGETILNFHLTAKDYGYKELVSEPHPLYNETYQRIQPVYEETKTSILEKWEVVNVLTLDEYKEQRLADLEIAYKEALQGNFESLGYVFSYDKEAQDLSLIHI